MRLAIRKFIIRRYRWILLFGFTLLLGLSIYQSVKGYRLLRGRIIAAERDRPLIERELSSLDEKIERVERLIDEAETDLRKVHAEVEELDAGNEEEIEGDMISRRAELYAKVQELDLIRQDLDREREDFIREKNRLNEIRNLDQELLGKHRQLLILSWLWPLILNALWLLNYYLYRNNIRAVVERLYPVGLCRSCFYNLEGNQSGVCPECGTPVAIESPSPA